MIKSKKALLGSLATVAMVATPIAAVVSCGNKNEVKNGFQAQLESIKKGQTVEEYRTSVIEFVKTHYAKSTGIEFTDDELKAIKDARDASGIKTAAEAIEGVKKAIKEVNTIVTVNGKDYDLGGYVKADDLKFTTITKGNAKVEAVAAVAAKAVAKADVDKAIDAALTKEAIVKILNDYTTDDMNTTPVDTTKVTGNDLQEQKDSAKSLTTTLFKKGDAVKEVKAKAEVATIIGLSKTDGNTIEINLGRFVEQNDVQTAIKFKVAGNPRQTATTTLAKIGSGSIDEINTLDNYAKELIRLFTSTKTIFADEAKKNNFKDTDESMKSIENAAKAQGATAKTVLAAAKAIKIYQ